MTNHPDGTLYVGATTNPARRAWKHREGVVEGFTTRYGLKRLVFAEPHETGIGAIQREKNVEKRTRACKVRLILDADPGWADLYDLLV